ncbi:MarR family transcriptional regulator [Thalassobius vesicularis]|uniref:MarR family transcriptional regulator n=1 Tax=Thalassobius vesicularis TaxID=1294297 RepID=A0A4S3MCA3_9RHOB|nr:MarR family winged helix-turn-helix transcriptional regulator [Thalassobius vesicularis]THD76469.1 MarR family transcriptional regulator [Thalassobius vesicularis]
MAEFHDMPGHLVRRAHQVATALFHDHMTREGIDITPFQFAAMSAIKLQPGLDQATVAAWTACDRATIGGVVDRLVEKGYVARSVSEKDRRARVLNLTDSGRATLEQVETIARSIQDEITMGLDVEEKETLVRLLKRVSENHPK